MQAPTDKLDSGAAADHFDLGALAALLDAAPGALAGREARLGPRTAAALNAHAADAANAARAAVDRVVKVVDAAAGGGCDLPVPVSDVIAELSVARACVPRAAELLLRAAAAVQPSAASLEAGNSIEPQLSRGIKHVTDVIQRKAAAIDAATVDLTCGGVGERGSTSVAFRAAPTDEQQRRVADGTAAAAAARALRLPDPAELDAALTAAKAAMDVQTKAAAALAPLEAACADARALGDVGCGSGAGARALRERLQATGDVLRRAAGPLLSRPTSPAAASLRFLLPPELLCRIDAADALRARYDAALAALADADDAVDAEANSVQRAIAGADDAPCDSPRAAPRLADLGDADAGGEVNAAALEASNSRAANAGPTGGSDGDGEHGADGDGGEGPTTTPRRRGYAADEPGGATAVVAAPRSTPSHLRALIRSQRSPLAPPASPFTDARNIDALVDRFGPQVAAHLVSTVLQHSLTQLRDAELRRAQAEAAVAAVARDDALIARREGREDAEAERQAAADAAMRATLKEAADKAAAARVIAARIAADGVCTAAASKHADISMKTATAAAEATCVAERAAALWWASATAVVATAVIALLRSETAQAAAYELVSRRALRQACTAVLAGGGGTQSARWWAPWGGLAFNGRAALACVRAFAAAGPTVALTIGAAAAALWLPWVLPARVAVFFRAALRAAAWRVIVAATCAAAVHAGLYGVGMACRQPLPSRDDLFAAEVARLAAAAGGEAPAPPRCAPPSRCGPLFSRGAALQAAHACAALAGGALAGAFVADVPLSAAAVAFATLVRSAF